MSSGTDSHFSELRHLPHKPITAALAVLIIGATLFTTATDARAVSVGNVVQIIKDAVSPALDLIKSSSQTANDPAKSNKVDPVQGQPILKGRQKIRDVFDDQIKRAPKDGITLFADLRLAESGDQNNNGQIDAGDTITFYYIIQNSTAVDYPFSVLETNILTKDLNYIRNIFGGHGLDDKQGSIKLPNLWLGANSMLAISFDADVSYFSTGTLKLSTQAELFDQNGHKLASAPKKTATIHPTEKDQIPFMVQSESVITFD